MIDIKNCMMLLNNMINKLIEESQGIIDQEIMSKGLYNLATKNIEITDDLVYDFKYFILSKSIKTLKSIRMLLDNELNEDAIMLVRNIYENYLNCRYLSVNTDKIHDFIHNPYNVANFYTKINNEGNYVDSNNNVIGHRFNPSELKLESDKKYFFIFYEFLCEFTHCNYATIECYIDSGLKFTYSKGNYKIVSRLFTIFVYTKLLKTIIAGEGKYEEILEESINLQKYIFDSIIVVYEEHIKNNTDRRAKHMKKMMKQMKESILS